MSEIKCPSCGSPNVEQIDVDKYQCPYCGKSFSYRDAVVPQQAQQTQVFEPEPIDDPTGRLMNGNQNSKPDNNMVWAILCTLFCCFPLGIVSIVNAAKVDGLYGSGDYAGAQKAADDAKNYAKCGLVCGFILYIIYINVVVFLTIGDW